MSVRNAASAPGWWRAAGENRWFQAEGEFRMLAVAPTARGRGMGEVLVRRCEERAREAGATRMWLTTIDEMSHARQVYVRLGYAPVPARDWFPEELPDLPMRAWSKEL